MLINFYFPLHLALSVKRYAFCVQPKIIFLVPQNFLSSALKIDSNEY